MKSLTISSLLSLTTLLTPLTTALPLNSTVQRTAGGFLPPIPSSIAFSPDTITSLQLILTNELFEVAFFESLYNNITSREHGYTLGGSPLDDSASSIAADIERIVAQEYLHAAQAAGLIAAAGGVAPGPCSYNFHTTTFDDAIALSGTFTDLVLGTLQDVQLQAAIHGDLPIVPAVGSVIGNEGEQEGFFRLLQHKRPSSAPLLTGSARSLAWSALSQAFIVPGSCGGDFPALVNLTILSPLSVDPAGTQPSAKDAVVDYIFTCADCYATQAAAPTATSFWQADNSSTSGYICNTTSNGVAEGATPEQMNSVVYLSGQLAPVAVPLSIVSFENTTGTVSASFPFKSAEFSDGLTIATISAGCVFSTADDVASKSVFGPALIEIK